MLCKVEGGDAEEPPQKRRRKNKERVICYEKPSLHTLSAEAAQERERLLVRSQAFP